GSGVRGGGGASATPVRGRAGSIGRRGRKKSTSEGSPLRVAPRGAAVPPNGSAPPSPGRRAAGSPCGPPNSGRPASPVGPGGALSARSARGRGDSGGGSDVPPAEAEPDAEAGSLVFDEVPNQSIGEGVARAARGRRIGSGVDGGGGADGASARPLGGGSPGSVAGPDG